MKRFKELRSGAVSEARKYSVLDTKKNEIVRPNITKAAAQKLVDKDPDNRIMGSPEFIHDKRTDALKEFFDLGEAEDNMPASPDEAGMALDQAKFIGYVAEEIMEYIQGNKDFPEWMQNKLSAFHEKAKGMHAVMAGKYDETNESLRSDIAKLSAKFPEGSKVKMKHDGKVATVLSVGKDFIKVGVGSKTMDHKPDELVPVKESDVEESSASWAKSLETIAKKKQLDKISDKDKELLIKLADMMKNANK